MEHRLGGVGKGRRHMPGKNTSGGRKGESGGLSEDGLSQLRRIQILTQTGQHSEGREWQCQGLRMQDSGGRELGSSAQDPEGGQPVGLATL